MLSLYLSSNLTESVLLKHQLLFAEALPEKGPGEELIRAVLE
jgi:hypothetical protein